jgi:hypothetical protein
VRPGVQTLVLWRRREGEINGILSFEGKWMELEIIMSNEISQSQKENDHIFYHMQNLFFI